MILGKKIQKTKPLAGKRILITRAQDQSAELISILEKAGAEPVVFSTIRTVPTHDWAECDKAIEKVRRWDGFIFTSANAVRYFIERLRSLVPDYRAVMLQQPIYAVGSATGKALSAYGLSAICFDSVHNAGELADAVSKHSRFGQQFLFPSGQLANETIEHWLSHAGISVHRIVVYETEAADTEELEIITLALQERQIDMITFFSPSSFTNFVKVISKTTLDGCRIAAIGSTTAKAITDSGLHVDVIPPKPTAEQLVESIEKFYES